MHGARIAKSTAGPGWPEVDSGGYIVQPPPTPVEPGALGRKSEMTRSPMAGGSSQNEMLFMRGKANVRRADHDRHKPVAEAADHCGMTMKKIMIRPCAVTKTLKSSGLMEDLDAGRLQLGAHGDRQPAAD